VYGKYDQANTILAGFSYGALTAFVVASQRPPTELWLFSLSPYFSEDIPLLKLAWLRYIGKQRTERFWRVSFNDLAPKVICKTLVFLGEKEAKDSPILEQRAIKASKLLPKAQLIIIPGADHDATESRYIEAIKKSI